MIYAEIYFACVSLMNFIVCIFSSCFFTFTLMLSGTQREVNRFSLLLLVFCLVEVSCWSLCSQ